MGGGTVRRLVSVVRWGLALLVPIFLVLATLAVTAPAASADGASLFSGVIQDASGNPVPNVDLSLSTDNANYPGVTTGSDGAFSLTVPAGIYHLDMEDYYGTTGAVAALYSFKCLADVDLSSSLTDRTITLPPLVNLNVAVHDSLGNPVAGASVISTDERMGIAVDQILAGIAMSGTASGYEDFYMPSVTDANGNTPVIHVLPGTWAGFPVEVTPPAGSGLTEAAVTYTDPITADTTIPVIVASLDGSLVDSAGQPLANQSVALQAGDGSTAAQTTTSEDGSFAVTVPPGTYTIDVSGPIGDPTSYAVKVPGVDLTNGKKGTFQLPTEAVSVVVTGSGGAAEPGATVALKQTKTSFGLLGGTATGTESATETTGANGGAALEMLPASSATLTVTPPVGFGLLTKTTTFTPANGATVSVHLIPVGSDTTPPTTTANADSLWHRIFVLNLTASDAGCGVASSEYRIDGGGWRTGTAVRLPLKRAKKGPASKDGNHLVEYRSTDNAGNVEQIRSCQVKIDTTAPLTIDNSDLLPHTSFRLLLSPADALSGVASTKYAIDGGPWQVGRSVLLSALSRHSRHSAHSLRVGSHTISYYSTDNAGNVETPGGCSYRFRPQHTRRVPLPTFCRQDASPQPTAADDSPSLRLCGKCDCAARLRMMRHHPSPRPRHSKSGPVHAGCGFNSHLRHHFFLQRATCCLVTLAARRW